MKIIAIPEEDLMKQVVETINVISMIDARANHMDDSEEFVSQSVVTYNKHLTESLWWFTVDDLLGGVSDYSSPQIQLILKLVENMSMVHEQIQNSADDDLRANTLALTSPLLMMDVDLVQAGFKEAEESE